MQQSLGQEDYSVIAKIQLIGITSNYLKCKFPIHLPWRTVVAWNFPVITKGRAYILSPVLSTLYLVTKFIRGIVIWIIVIVST